MCKSTTGSVVLYILQYNVESKYIGKYNLLVTTISAIFPGAGTVVVYTQITLGRVNLQLYDLTSVPISLQSSYVDAFSFFDLEVNSALIAYSQHS